MNIDKTYVLFAIAGLVIIIAMVATIVEQASLQKPSVELCPLCGK
jgi:formate dehydrogenase maturation protein FdhE